MELWIHTDDFISRYRFLQSVYRVLMSRGFSRKVRHVEEGQEIQYIFQENLILFELIYSFCSVELELTGLFEFLIGKNLRLRIICLNCNQINTGTCHQQRRKCAICNIIDIYYIFLTPDLPHILSFAY